MARLEPQKALTWWQWFPTRSACHQKVLARLHDNANRWAQSLATTERKLMVPYGVPRKNNLFKKMAPAYVIELMQTIFQTWPQWVPTSLHWYPHLCGPAVLGHPHSPSFRWLHCDTGQHVVSMLTPPLEPICTVPPRLPQHPPLDLDQALAAALKPKWLCYEFMRFDGN